MTFPTDQSELLSLLPSLLSLLVVVAVLIGLSIAVIKFTMAYGLVIISLGAIYFLLQMEGFDVNLDFESIFNLFENTRRSSAG